MIGRRKRGIVIIISFIFLTILSSIGLAFLLFSRLHEKELENFVSLIKVKLVSQSGAEFAISRLQDLAQKRAHDAIYEEGGKKSSWGYYLEAYEDTNNNGRFDSGEEVFEDYDNNGSYNIPKITSVSEPSFSEGKKLFLEKTNKSIGYSNKLASLGSNIFSGYILKVRDTHSMIYINGPTVDEEGKQLEEYVKNMLNLLGDLVVYPGGKSFNERASELGKVNKLGDRIAQILAQKGKIPNKFILMDKSYLPENLSNLRFEKEEYDLIKDYITTYAWIDTSVINPASFEPFHDNNSPEKAPYSKFKIKSKGAQSSFFENTTKKYTFNFESGRLKNKELLNTLSLFGMCPPLIRGVNCDKPGRVAPPSSKKSQTQRDSSTDILLDNLGVEEDEIVWRSPIKFQAEFPEYSQILQERAPININTAPREILITVFENLQGWYCDTSKPNKTFVNPCRYKETKPITRDQAARLADHIIAYRRKQPFTNWNQFERFLFGKEPFERFDSRYIEHLKGANGFDKNLNFLDKYQKMVVFANVNPNTRMGDFNPDATYGAFFTDYVDKSKLLYHTTELTFSSMGYYEIESVGFIALERKGRERQQTEDTTPVEMLATHGLTYEVKLFSVFRHSNQRDFTKESIQIVDGKKITVKSKPSSSNVISYPENLLNLGTIETDSEGNARLKLPPRAAAGYDGYLSIAPRVLTPDEYAGLRFYNSFTISFEPEVAQYGAKQKAKIIGTADEKRSIMDTFKGYGRFPPNRQATPFQTNIAHLTRSTLYPDGYFAHETLRYPYKYDKNPESKYGWSKKGSREIIDEYLGYPEGIGKEEAGKWNLGKTGAVEFWFKPTWDVDEQEVSDKDTRTLFSVGDAEGVIEEETTITEQGTTGGHGKSFLFSCTKWAVDYATLRRISAFSSGVGFGDPTIVRALREAYRITKLIGPEILFPKPGEWGKWEALKAYVEERKSGGFSPSYAEARSAEAARRLNEIMYYESEEVQQEYEKRERTIRNFQFPEERFVIFARNKKLATFLGSNYVEESGADTFGNFKNAFVNLDKNSWKRGTWHHILVTWAPTSQSDNEEVEVALYLDGKKTSNPYKSSLLLLNERNTMFFGTNRFKKNVSNGFPLTADGTIADFKVYFNAKDALSRLNKRSRYWGMTEGPEQLYWSATIVEFPEARMGRLGTISWTERIPQSGGDILIKVAALDENGEESTEYAYPADNGGPYIGDDGVENCRCVNEDGTPIKHADIRFCPSRNGGGAPLIHLNLRYKSQDSKNKSKWSGIRYYVHFAPPQVFPITAVPILEDITITYIDKPQILKVSEMEVQLK